MGAEHSGFLAPCTQLYNSESSEVHESAFKPLGKVRVEDLAKSEAAPALKQLQSKYAYLAMPLHAFYPWIKECEEAILEGDEERAKDILLRVEAEVEQEESTLAAAFNLFVPPGAHCLTDKEVKTMMDYLCFPSSDADVAKLMDAVDTDGDKQMSLVEFQMYVGRIGGSTKLFEQRRRQLQRKQFGGGFNSEMTSTLTNSTPLTARQVDSAILRVKLSEAGIGEDAQAYWRMVVDESEFQEAAKLVECQKRAVRHIRAQAKANHERALPLLQKRVHALGKSDSDLWMTLAWIREMAPILIHLNLTKMIPFLESDTHYRNQFETATSGGLLKPSIREKWERDLFGGSYDGAEGSDRCKYGVLNAMNDHRGVVACKQYGDSYIVLKDVRLRCTFSPEDSANLKADRLAVLDHYAHVLHEYSDPELTETMKVATSIDDALLGDSEKVGKMKYKEGQVHGPVAFDQHVLRLVAATRHRSNALEKKRITEVCQKHGWQFSWMDEERERMSHEERERLGADAWQQRMNALMEKGVPDAPNVPEGYCRKGCGRPVAPGVTRSGNAFRTCCRGCVLGFGHDLICGNVDPAKLGPGKCRNGCGRDVNPGLRPSGRPYETCCKGCVSGAHDTWCGIAPPVVEVGKCRMGCGRGVAEAPDGSKKFDTCCRGCASGKDHTDVCKG